MAEISYLQRALELIPRKLGFRLAVEGTTQANFAERLALALENQPEDDDDDDDDGDDSWDRDGEPPLSEAEEREASERLGLSMTARQRSRLSDAEVLSRFDSGLAGRLNATDEAVIKGLTT